MNPMQNKTPEERKAIAAKAHATRRHWRWVNPVEEARRLRAAGDYAGAKRMVMAMAFWMEET